MDQIWLHQTRPEKDQQDPRISKKTEHIEAQCATSKLDMTTLREPGITLPNTAKRQLKKQNEAMLVFLFIFMFVKKNTLESLRNRFGDLLKNDKKCVSQVSGTLCEVE